MPIAAIYPLEQVRAAYTELASGHVYGKIVLSTEMPADASPAPSCGGAIMTGTSDAADRNSGVIAEFRASHGRAGGYFAEAPIPLPYQ